MFKTDIVFDLIAKTLGIESNKKELHALLELYALAYVEDLEATEDLSALAACVTSVVPTTRCEADASTSKHAFTQTNEMLTLAQLRAMEGELVWVVDLTKDACPRPHVVYKRLMQGGLVLIDADEFPIENKAVPYFSFGVHNGHGVMWVAYRHRPEEGDCDATD